MGVQAVSKVEDEVGTGESEKILLPPFVRWVTDLCGVDGPWEEIFHPPASDEGVKEGADATVPFGGATSVDELEEQEEGAP